MVGGFKIGALPRYLYNYHYVGGLVCFIRSGRQSWSSVVASHVLPGLSFLRNDEKLLRIVFGTLEGRRDMESWRPCALHDRLALDTRRPCAWGPVC